MDKSIVQLPAVDVCVDFELISLGKALIDLFFLSLPPIHGENSNGEKSVKETTQNSKLEADD